MKSFHDHAMGGANGHRTARYRDKHSRGGRLAIICGLKSRGQHKYLIAFTAVLDDDFYSLRRAGSSCGIHTGYHPPFSGERAGGGRRRDKMRHQPSQLAANSPLRVALLSG